MSLSSMLSQQSIKDEDSSPTKTITSSKLLGLSEKQIKSPNDIMLVRLMANCKNGIERGMLLFLADNRNIKGMVGVLFLLATLQCLKTMSLFENLLHVTFLLVQSLNNYLRTGNDMTLFEESVKKLDGNEKIRTVVSMAVFTLRMVLLPKHKMIFLPVLFIWFAGANKFHTQSTFWGLVPTYYALFLYISNACYFGYYEFIENGYSTAFLDIISNYFVLMGCVWMFTYYLVNVTGFLKHKVEKLQDTRKRLENALEARSRFIAHISHEFRCPIMSSIGCLELLKETPLNEKQNDLVDTIVSSNRIILLLVEDILKVAKVEHEAKDSKKEEDTNMQVFNLFESLKSLKDIISGYASNFKVNLKFEIDTRVNSLLVFSNPSKLHQILSNLLTNAVKASKTDDQVMLICKVLEETKETIKIRFTCKDFGCGIPKHLVGSIFEPFVQLKNTSQSKVPSSGLGLTTVLQLIKTLDGSINVDSQEGNGSTFMVELTFKLGLGAESSEINSKNDIEDIRSKLHLNVHNSYLNMMSNLEEGEKVKRASFNSNIIIAEDNPINRKVIVKMINSMNQTTDFVCDGIELVEKFNPKTHNVVITDMNMPKMNGLEAAKVLRQKYGRTFKIYLLTGNVAISLTDVDELGVFDGILTKPCSKHELKKCLNLSD